MANEGVNDIVDLENSFNETDLQSSHQTENSTNIKQLSEDLFVIKESLLDGTERKVYKQTESCLTQINGMLEDYPVLCEKLYKWKFLTNEALYLLRSKYFDTTLIIVTKIISRLKLLPSEYIKSKFIFFITEKLYNKLKLSGESTGMSVLERDVLEDINIGTICIDNVNDDIDNVNDGIDNVNSEIGSGKETINRTNKIRANKNINKFIENSLNRSIENIIIFIEKMITANKDIIYALCDNGAFVLINSVITNATCKLYNEIFKDVFFYNKLYTGEKKHKGMKGGLYEIQRKYFDPEVIFWEKQVIELQCKNRMYKKGIYEKIYNECHVLRKLFEFNIGESLDLLLYKRTVFMNEDLDLLIREKNVKALKAYRNGLECGRTPDQGYLFLLIQLLDEEKTKRDACLLLYYFIEFIGQNKHFTEMRIRKIFECLEKECTLECQLNCKEKEPFTVRNNDNSKEENTRSPIYYDTGIANITIEDKILSNVVIDNNNGNHENFKLTEKGLYLDNNYMNQTNNNTNHVEQIKDSFCSYNSKESFNFSIINDVPADLNERKFSEDSHLTENNFDINLCDRLRIIKLIKHLYGFVERRYFYKPSYLILLKSQMIHCLTERDFLNSYFKDFVWFVEHGKNNMARALFPVIKNIEPRESIQRNTAETNMNVIDHDAQIDLGDYMKEDSEDEILIDRINKMKSANKM